MNGVILLALAGVLVAFVFIIDLMRRHKLRERYAVAWFALTLIMLVMGLFPAIPGALARWFGFVLPVNFVFFCAIVILLGMVLHLSSALGVTEERLRTAIEAVGLLEQRVRELEEKNDRADTDAR